MIPDRLPSLVLLVGFWIPPAVVGSAAADLFHRSAKRVRPALIYSLLVIFSLCWSAAWFLFQLDRIPPYVPGATRDPTYAPPEAVAGLAFLASALVLPGSAIACMSAFRIRARMLRRTSAARLSAQQALETDERDFEFETKKLVDLKGRLKHTASSAQTKSDGSLVIELYDFSSEAEK